MKKFFTFCAVLASLACPAFAAPVSIMGDGKAPGTVTAYDIAGKYQLGYYSLILVDGGYKKGDIACTTFQVEFTATDDETLVMKGFYKEDADDIAVSFDSENMTLTIPNNIPLGKLVYNEGTVNEKVANATIQLLSTTNNSLLDKDIVFKVNPEKRKISWAPNIVFIGTSDSYQNAIFDEQVAIIVETNSYIDLLGWIDFDYVNILASHNSNTQENYLKQNIRAEYDEEANTITLYNYSAEGWEYPTVFNLNKTKTKMTAVEQVFIDWGDYGKNYFSDAYTNSYVHTATIENGVGGYQIHFSDWQEYSDKNGTYPHIYTNFYGILTDDFWGETAELPVITSEPIDEETFNITIAHSDSNAKIYYTTDGSLPTESSTEYTEPFMVSDGTNVKAFAVVEDVLPSHVALLEIPKHNGVNVIINNDLNVYVNNGRIVAPEGAKAFNLSGAEVPVGKVLPAGIYVVASNGKSVKVLVK